MFDFINQSYLLTAKLLTESTDAIPLDEKEKKRVKFYTQYFIDAMSPSNFVNLNPDVITEAMRTNGQSLIDGMQNLMSDLEKGRITMTDESAFTLGENIGMSKGSVVFRNHLFELVQYESTTETVHQRPLLIVPPCINKFYFLTSATKFLREVVCRPREHGVPISWAKYNTGIQSHRLGRLCSGRYF